MTYVENATMLTNLSGRVDDIIVAVDEPTSTNEETTNDIVFMGEEEDNKPVTAALIRDPFEETGKERKIMKAAKKGRKRGLKSIEVKSIFECDDCGMACMRKSTATAHFWEHLGLRPYECGYCLKGFRRRSHLVEHRNRHKNGQRPFKCDYCDQRFERHLRREYHQSRSHPPPQQPSSEL